MMDYQITRSWSVFSDPCHLLERLRLENNSVAIIFILHLALMEVFPDLLLSPLMLLHFSEFKLLLLVDLN